MRTQKTVSVSLLLFTLLSAFLAGCGALVNTANPDDTALVTPAAQPTTVVVTLEDNKIILKQTAFSPGVTYEFIVANAGQKHHGIAILPSGLNVTQMTAAQLQQAALLIVADVAPTKGATVTYTFPTTSAGASYQLTSPVPGDFKAGLTLAITVKTGP